MVATTVVTREGRDGVVEAAPVDASLDGLRVTIAAGGMMDAASAARAACTAAGIDPMVTVRTGYDHGDQFISGRMADRQARDERRLNA